MKKLNYQWYLISVGGGQEEKIIAQIRLELAREEWKEYKKYIQDLKIFKDTNQKNAIKGYILCHCQLAPALERLLYYMNKNTNLRINGFLPNPISPKQVENILAKIQEQNFEIQEDALVSEFQTGNLVKIKKGVFANYEGRITHLDKKKQIVRIVVESSGWEITNIPINNCQKVVR